MVSHLRKEREAWSIRRNSETVTFKLGVNAEMQGRLLNGSAFTRGILKTACKRLTMSALAGLRHLIPPIDIPAHVRAIRRQLTAAQLGSRVRPGTEKELCGPNSQVFPCPRELFWSSR